MRQLAAMAVDKGRRILNWGAVRSETLSGVDGTVVLQGTEAGNLDRAAKDVQQFVREYARRFGVEDDELQEALLDSEWLLGYVAGACIAAVRSTGGTSDTTLIGFASRVCGELMGGGADNKLKAYERLNRSEEHPDFRQGSEDAQRNFAEKWAR